MSDSEDFPGDDSHGGPEDDDVSLPKSTMAKLIQEMMPADMVCSKETRDLVTECCIEFVEMIAAEANELCENEKKKTIMGEHVLGALEKLGFEDYIPEVRDVLNEHQSYVRDREKRNSKMDLCGLTQEELLRQQQALFEEARLKYQQQHASQNSPHSSSKSTTEA